MKSIITIVANVLVVSLLISCTSQAEKRAAADFQQVDALVAKNDVGSALMLLDTILARNSNDYGIIGEAMKRRKPLAINYHKGIITSSEALLAGLDSRISLLTRDFILTPGEAGMPGTYEHRRQTVESSWNRTFLKIGLNENGDIWMTSHYYGNAWIDHTSVRVYDQDSYIVTDTIGLGHEWNRKVEDGADKWETIDFREGSDAGAIAFIADNAGKSVKARFTGKSFYYIVLESYDKDAFKKGMELAQLLKERSGLRQTIGLQRAELGKLGEQAGTQY